MVGLRRLSEGDEDCHTKSQSTEKHAWPNQRRLAIYIPSWTLSCFFSCYFLLLWDCVSSRATATSMRAWWVCEDCRREMKTVTQKVKVQRSMTKPKKISYITSFIPSWLWLASSSLATFSSFEIVCLAERQLRACAHGGSAKTVGGRWRLSHKKSKYRKAWPNQRRLAI